MRDIEDPVQRKTRRDVWVSYSAFYWTYVPRGQPVDGILRHQDGVLIPRPAFPLFQHTNTRADSHKSPKAERRRSHKVTFYGTDLLLFAQNHFDAISGDDNVDLLFLDVLQFEFILWRKNYSQINTQRSWPKKLIQTRLITASRDVTGIKYVGPAQMALFIQDKWFIGKERRDHAHRKIFLTVFFLWEMWGWVNTEKLSVSVPGSCLSFQRQASRGEAGMCGTLSSLCVINAGACSLCFHCRLRLRISDPQI